MATNTTIASKHRLDRLYIGLLLVIFGGIVLHAPFEVGFGTLFPHYELLIKSWKEILMLVAAGCMVIILYRRRQFGLLKSPIVLLIAAYAIVCLLLLPFFSQGVNASLAGILIDLRYLFFFVLVYVAARLYPSLRPHFIKVGVVGALVVLVFALLQVFVLPADILKYLGYNTDTIAPYLTVDKNPDFIRINSTLRGPNSVGAYAVIVLALTLAYVVKNKRPMKNRNLAIVTRFFVIAGLIALWVSYSRSAIIGALAAFVAIGITMVKRVTKVAWIVIAVVAVAVLVGLAAGRNSSFVSNVLLHENPSGGSAVSSNDGHLESLQDGIVRTLHQPFGAGIGSTGSPSLLGKSPLIIENQYLYVAHEAGWVGLILFAVIIFLVFKQLWHRRHDWLALGVFASGIGLLLIGLLLPVFADDTIVIIWWGLAALAIGGKQRG